MTVIVTLDTAETYRLDRRLRVADVAKRINDARTDSRIVDGPGWLIEFQNDGTPSRAFYLDPAHVVAIVDDGYSY